MYVTFWLKFWKNGLQSKRYIQLEPNLGHRWYMKSRSCWRGQRSPGEVKGHLRSNCIICSKCPFPSQTFTNWNQTWVIDESRKAAHNDEVKGHLPRSKVNWGEAVKYVPNVHFFPKHSPIRTKLESNALWKHIIHMLIRSKVTYQGRRSPAIKYMPEMSIFPKHLMKWDTI